MTQRERQILRLIEKDPMISQQELADRLGITRSSVAVHISNLMQKGNIIGRGYVLRNRAFVLVVGGTNVDIAGRATGTIVPEDSNPGKVLITLGGVGRNVAHNLSLLGVDVKMLTAYGDDDHGVYFRNRSTELGIDIRHAMKVPGGTTCSYLYIAGQDGEMKLAVSDMELCEYITPEYLTENLAYIQNARIVIADTNIPQESLIYLAEHSIAPLFVDPVSVAKAGKVLPILNRIHTLKPNRLEAEVLSGVKINNKADVEKAAKVLLDKGVQRVVISLGPDGVYAATKTESLWRDAAPGKMVSTTGCGDAFTAALAWSWLEDLDMDTSVLAGTTAGAIAMEYYKTINPAMSTDLLKSRMYLGNV